MNILEALVKLRDDLKTWVTNNLNALNDKIDEKTIPIDSELSSTSTNPVQNKVISTQINSLNNLVGDTKVSDQISTAIASQKHFSGDYNDLTNAPSISEDDSDNVVIVDEAGNIIFKVDENGAHSTALTLNGEDVKNAIDAKAAQTNLDKTNEDVVALQELVGDTSVSDQINDAINSKQYFSGDYNDLTNKPNITEDDSQNVVITDEAGYIVFQVDADGTHTTTLNANVVKVDGQDIVNVIDTKVADLVNSAPETLDTLGELATAMETNSDAIEALETIATSKAAQSDLDKINADVAILFGLVGDEKVADRIAAHTERTDIHVTAADKEIWNNKSDFSGDYSDLENAPNITENDDGDMVIVDEDGNIIFKVDVDGTHMTTLNTNVINLAGSDIMTIINGNIDGKLESFEVIVDNALSDTSINPVQNKVVNSAIADIYSYVSSLTGDTPVSEQIKNKTEVQLITWEADD